MSGKICVESRSPAQTELIGEKLAAQLSGGEVIALYGGLGMGKTNFVRGLARGLGVEEGVSSPTFALVNEYHGRLTLYHFDMYRVTTWEDLYSTGFFRLFGYRRRAGCRMERKHSGGLAGGFYSGRAPAGWDRHRPAYYHRRNQWLMKIFAIESSRKNRPPPL